MPRATSPFSGLLLNHVFRRSASSVVLTEIQDSANTLNAFDGADWNELVKMENLLREIGLSSWGGGGRKEKERFEERQFRPPSSGILLLPRRNEASRSLPVAVGDYKQRTSRLNIVCWKRFAFNKSRRFRIPAGPWNLLSRDFLATVRYAPRSNVILRIFVSAITSRRGLLRGRCADGEYYCSEYPFHRGSRALRWFAVRSKGTLFLVRPSRSINGRTRASLSGTTCFRTIYARNTRNFWKRLLAFDWVLLDWIIDDLSLCNIFKTRESTYMQYRTNRDLIRFLYFRFEY